MNPSVTILLQSQVMAQDDPTEIVDSISLPEKDPFPGKGYKRL